MNESQNSNKETIQASAAVDIFHCVFCNAEVSSENYGYVDHTTSIFVCQKCVLCAKCGRDTQMAEIAYCIKNNQKAIFHARCMVLDQKALDLEIELLNLARLTYHPDPSLSREELKHRAINKVNQVIGFIPHDIQLLILDQATAIAAAISLALSSNRREVEHEVDTREKARVKKAQEKRTEKELTEDSAKDRKTEFSAAVEKQIKTFTSLGFSREQAIKQVLAAKESAKGMLK